MYLDGTTEGRSVPTSYISWLNHFKSQGHKIKSVAFTAQGGYAIIYGKNGYRYYNIPNGLVGAFQQASNESETMLSVAISPNGGWILISGESVRHGGNLPVRFRERLNLLLGEEGQIQMTGNSFGGWIITYRENGELKSYYANLTEEQEKLTPAGMVRQGIELINKGYQRLSDANQRVIDTTRQ